VVESGLSLSRNEEEIRALSPPSTRAASEIAVFFRGIARPLLETIVAADQPFRTMCTVKLSTCDGKLTGELVRTAQLPSPHDLRLLHQPHPAPRPQVQLVRWEAVRQMTQTAAPGLDLITLGTAGDSLLRRANVMASQGSESSGYTSRTPH
jgi:hypothetical protein